MNKENKKNDIHTAVGLIIILIEVAIFGAIFYAVTTQIKVELSFAIFPMKKNANLNVNEVTNVNTNNSNLGVYNNTKYQYTVTLPTGWRANIDEFCSMDNVGFGQDGTGEKYQCPPDGGGWVYNISAIQNTTITAAQEDIVNKNHPDAKVVDDKIKGKSAKHYLYTFTSEYLGGTFTQEGYLVNNGSTVFDIWTQLDGSVSEYDSAFDQFAKSFTFTDETAGWQTYKNEQYGYLIQYPPTCEPEKNDLSSQSVSYPSLFQAVFCNAFMGEAYSIVTMDNPENLSIDNYNQKYSNLGIEKDSTWSALTISGETGRIYNVPDTYKNIIVPHNKRMFNIWSQSEKVTGGYDFDQILSTFQFTK